MTEKRTDEETETTSDTKRMRLVKFGADWCGPCRSLAKAKTLEKFVEKHPEVALEIVDIEEDEAMADEYEVQHVPTIVFEDMEGEELLRDTGAITPKDLEKLYEKASKELVCER